MNLVATLSVRNMPRALAGLMRSVGLSLGYRLLIRGVVGDNVFKSAFATGAPPPTSGLLGAAQLQTKLAAISRTYGKDFLAKLRLTAKLPDVASVGPFTFKDHRLNLRGGDGSMSFGIDVATATANAVTTRDVHFT